MKTNRFFSCKACCFKSPGHGKRRGLCFNNTLQGVRNRGFWRGGGREGGDGGGGVGEGGGELFLSPLLLRQSPVPFRVALGVGCVGKEVGTSKELEFLEREGLQPFIMTVCHRGSSTFQGKLSAGLTVTGPGKRSGLEKIYREAEILTCTWGPKTALAIPARRVVLLRGVDMLWKYILFMKKARLDFPKNSLYPPQLRLCGLQPSLGGRGAWSATL